MFSLMGEIEKAHVKVKLGSCDWLQWTQKLFVIRSKFNFFPGFLENLRHQKDILKLTGLYHKYQGFAFMEISREIVCVQFIKVFTPLYTAECKLDYSSETGSNAWLGTELKRVKLWFLVMAGHSIMQQYPTR